MNHQSAGGLDGWVPTVLRCVDKKMCETLAQLFAHNAYMCCWPESMTMVRTQLIPKHVNAHHVHEQRPLSILSIWYRLWSRATLTSLGDEMMKKPNCHLRGGLPGRSVDASILTWALQVESAIHSIPTIEEPSSKMSIYLATLDAVKCFDRIGQEGVLRSARTFGLPNDAVRCLCGFYQGIQRVLTFGGLVDLWCFHPTVGIPQGCALSAYLCNILVSSWADSIEASRAVPEAYLDDRTIYARTMPQLMAAWEQSQKWDLAMGWRLNQSKTYLACAPPDPAATLRFPDDTEVSCVPSIQSLGHQVAFSYHQAGTLQAQRWKTALKSCERIEVLGLAPNLSQKVIASVVLKQFSYGIQTVPTPIRQCRSLRAAIKHASHTHGRRHAWPILASLVQRPDQLDPQASTIYCHMLAVLRALRNDPACLEWWLHVGQHDIRIKPQGPRGVTRHYMQKLQVTEVEDGLRWEGEGESIHVVSTEWLRTKHVVRVWLRRWLLRMAEQSHANLRGAANCDIPTTVRLIRKRDSPAQQLCTILADGTWSMKVQAAIGWRETPQCVFCEAPCEDMCHIWYSCRQWAPHRKLLAAHAEWMQSQAPATACCLLCPADVPQALKAQWPQLQAEAVAILRARDRAIDERGERWTRLKQQDRAEGKAMQPSKQEPHWHFPTEEQKRCCVPFPFKGTYPDQVREHRWPSSRAQWHRISWFFTKVRMFKGPKSGGSPEFPRVSILEVYIAYLMATGWERYESQISYRGRGHWLTTQVERFRTALACWSYHATTVDLLPFRQTEGPHSDWGGRFGIGNFQMVRAPILLPGLDVVREWIHSIPSQVQQYARVGEVHAWRRLAVGRPDSQLSIQELPGTLPTTSLPGLLHRVKTKTECPMWLHQAALDDTWRKQIARKLIPSLPTFEWLGWLRREGISSEASARAYNASLHASLKRCSLLMQHNTKAGTRSWHMCVSVKLSDRAACTLCHETGYYSLSAAWLTSHCCALGGEDRSRGLAEAMRVLQREEASLKEANMRMKMLFRAFALV